MSWALQTLALLWIFKEPIYYWLACCGCGLLFGFFLVQCCLSVSATKPYLCAFASSLSSFVLFFFYQLPSDWLGVLKNCTKYDTHALMHAGKGEVWGKDSGQPEMSGRTDRNGGDREGQLGWKWITQWLRMADVWVHIDERVNKDICERRNWSHYWQTDLKHAQHYLTNLFFSLHLISWTFWWTPGAVTLPSGRRLIPICEDTTTAHCESACKSHKSHLVIN